MKSLTYSLLLKKLRKLLLVRRVVGDSMLPTLRPNQIVVASGWLSVRPGYVALIGHNGLEKIKRISKISNDSLYVIGDNPLYSTDSRDFGWLPKSAIIGRVLWAPGSRFKTNILRDSSVK